LGPGKVSVKPARQITNGNLRVSYSRLGLRFVVQYVIWFWFRGDYYWRTITKVVKSKRNENSKKGKGPTETDALFQNYEKYDQNRNHKRKKITDWRRGHTRALQEKALQAWTAASG